MAQTVRLTCPLCTQTLDVDPQAEQRIFDCPNCGNPIRIPDPDELRDRAAGKRLATERLKTQGAPRRLRWLAIGGALIALLVAGGLLYIDRHRQTLQMSDLERRSSDLELQSGLVPPDRRSAETFLASCGNLEDELQAMGERWVSDRKNHLRERLAKLKRAAQDRVERIR